MEKLPTSSKALRYLPFLVASAFFMQMLDATILNTAIPTIARSFNLSLIHISEPTRPY